MSPEQEKLASADLQLKKEFVDKQMALKKYVEEAERLALIDIINDPIVVHSLENYAKAFQEQDNLQRIKKTMKSLCRIRRKSIDIGPILETLTPPKMKKEAEQHKTFSIIPKVSKSVPFFKMGTPLATVPESREQALKDFKSHLQRINEIHVRTIPQPSFSRSLPLSSSHASLIKKMEKQDFAVRESDGQRQAKEITSAAAFRNGVFKAPSFTKFTESVKMGARGQQASGSKHQNSVATSGESPGMKDVEKINEPKKRKIFKSSNFSPPGA